MEHKVDYLNARVDALQRRIEELENWIEYKNALIDTLTKNLETYVNE